MELMVDGKDQHETHNHTHKPQLELVSVPSLKGLMAFQELTVVPPSRGRMVGAVS